MNNNDDEKKYYDPEKKYYDPIMTVFKTSVDDARGTVTKACARSVFPIEELKVNSSELNSKYKQLLIEKVIKKGIYRIGNQKATLRLFDLHFSNYLTTTFQSFEDGIDDYVFDGCTAKGVKGVLDDSYYKTTREKAENIGKAFSFAKAGFSKEAKRSEFRNLLFSAAGESFGTSNSARSALISYATNAEIDKFNSKGVIGFVDNLFNDAGITTIHRTNRVGNNILIYENNIAKIKVLFGKDVHPTDEPEVNKNCIFQSYHLSTYGFVPFSKRELVKIVIT